MDAVGIVSIVILALIVIIVFFVKRTFSGFVYSVAMVDIFLRIVHRIFVVNGLATFIDAYLPNSFESIIVTYTDGILQTVLVWGYIIIMVIFEFYTIRTFFRKR